ncbi:MAG: hypothetical protein KR126chlam4_00317 [Candidatus Anoxychlamydiales bacterium]|nr:hypothetical protein [Candidatus Anoxychlamydiales bacterium]NGX40495.1 hypothetical protein [Candidatus Anoxychlamydiales bacterium]HEU64017.1 hypothetical protein [Chlamydiota bacterium]
MTKKSKSKSKKVEEEPQLKKILLWIMEKRIYFFSLLASVVFLNIILYKLKPFFKKKSIDSSMLVEKTYSSWKESSYNNREKLTQLKAYIKKYPNLKPKYEGLIVQNLLINENFLKEDESLASSALDRTKDELPFYYEFAKVALLINKEDYVKALGSSKNLKANMLSDLSFLQSESLPAGAVLYSFNLLRIALLEAKLNNEKEEMIAWKELEDYLKMGSEKDLNENIKLAAKALKQIFNENEIELRDYILYRKSSLSSIES